MKGSSICLIILFSFLALSVTAQDGTLEAENGVIVGNNSGTVAGTVRWTGTDFEGYDGTNWISLTENGAIASLLEDADGDTKIDLEGSGDDDIIFLRAGNTEVGIIDSRDKLFLGGNAGNPSTGSSYNTGIGYNAMQTIQGGSRNCALGSNTLEFATSGFDNIAIGYTAIQDLVTGTANSVVGTYALRQLVHGSYNVAIGAEAMSSADSTDWNVAIGRSALKVVKNGDSNFAGGGLALTNLKDGFQNVALGYNAGRYVDDGSSENTLIGVFAGGGTFGGHENHRNTFIGSKAGQYNRGDASVMIGYRAGASEDKSNCLYIENSNADSTDALIYGEFDNDFLRLNAQVEVHKNSSIDHPHLRLSEQGDDGARINMSNDQTTNNWTISGHPETSAQSSHIDFYFDNEANGGAQTGNKFQLFGDGDASLYHSSNGATGAGFRLINGDNNAQYWRLYTAEGSGDLRFYSDNSSASARAWIDEATGAYSMASDTRVKNHIEELPSILDRTMLLNAKTYFYNEQTRDEQKSIGFLAQEAKIHFPELVTYHEDDDMYGVNYAGFSVVAIKAIQEQQEILEQLESSLDEKQKKIDAFEKKFDDQQRQINMLIDQNQKMMKSLKE